MLFTLFIDKAGIIACLVLKEDWLSLWLKA